MTVRMKTILMQRWNLKKWDEIECKFTKNKPAKFTRYFTKHKQLQIRNKMAKYIRERACVSRGFGQNPIEWLHFMLKSEIDDVAQDVRHRNVTLTVALQTLKGRILHLYNDTAKAVHDEGPYKLDNAYSNFSIDYDTWMDLLQEEKEAHLKRFFAVNHSTLKPHQSTNHNPIPTTVNIVCASSATVTGAASVSATVIPTISVPSTVVLAPVIPATVSPATVAPCNESLTIALPTVSTSAMPAAVPSATTIHVPVNPNLPKHLSLCLTDFVIPDDCIPRSTLECLHQNAEALIKEPRAIMQAASSDPRMMTVKSRHGKAPLIGQAAKK